MSNKLNIEQLVSSKLMDAEITPSQSTWAGIQRKLRWQKFLRFRPGQFNAYYLAGLIIAATGLIVTLSTKPASQKPMEIVESARPITNEISPSQNLSEAEKPKREKREPRVNREEAIALKPEPEPDQVTGLGVSADSIGAILEKEVSAQRDSISINEPNEERVLEEESPLIVVPIESVPDESTVKNQSSSFPAAYFTSSAQSGCAPLEVQFHNQSSNALTYLWSFGSEDRSLSSDPLYQFAEPGIYEVTLKSENQNGESSIYSITIEVNPVPSADFAIEEGLEGNDGHVSLNLLNYSSGANSFGWCLLTEDLTSCDHWTSEEFQPPLHLTDLKNGADQMRLITTNEFGCVDTTIKPLPIRVQSNDVKIKFATAFSPNPTGPGDGRFNPGEKRIDLFHPVILEVPSEYHLKVFTKRGEMVFDTEDVYQGWDGYIQGERSAGGVYVWMLEGTWINGESFTLRGDVTLIWQDIW